MSWQCTDSATRWMLNSKGESPCQLVSRVLQTCQPDAAIITASNGYSCYTRPNTVPSECCCSSITYALYSACWECQWGWQLEFNKAINTTYNNFVAGCQMPYISTFPPTVNPAIRSAAQIPSWAAMPPMGNTLWDINAAKANATFGAGVTSSATVRSSPTSLSGQGMGSPSVAPTAGTVAGAVIGSIAGLLLIGGLVFYFIFWRRKQRQQKLAPSTIHRSLQMSHPNSHSQPPPHVQPAPLTTTMQNEKPRSRSGPQPDNATGDDVPSQGQIEGAQWYFKLIPWRRRKIEHMGPGAKVDLAEEPVSPVSIGGKSNTDPTPHSGGGMSGGGGGGRPGSLGYQYAGVAPYLMGPGTGVGGGGGVGGVGGGEHGSVGHQTYSQTHGFGQVLLDPESPPPPPVVHVTPLTTPIPSRGQGYPGYGIPQVDTPQQVLHPPMPPPQQPQTQQQLHNRPLPLPPSSNSSPPNQNPFTDASIGQLHPIAPYPTLAQNRAAAGGATTSSQPPVSGSKRASAATSKGGKKRSRLQVVGNADSDDDSGSDGGGLPPSQQYLAEIAMSDAKRVDEKAILAQREREEEARQAAAASELHRRRAHLAQGGATAVPLSSARAGGSHDSHNSFAPPLSMPHQQLPTPSYSAYPSPPAAGPIVDASRSQPHLYPHPDSPSSHNLLHQQYQQPPRQYVDPRFTPPRITPALLADEARREEERIQEALRMAEERRKSVKNWVEESRQSMRGNGGMSVAERVEGPNASMMPTLSDVGHGSTSGGHGARIDLFGGEGGSAGGAGAPSSYKNRTGGGRW